MLAPPLENAALAKQGATYHRQIFQVSHGSPCAVYLRLYNEIVTYRKQAQVTHDHENANVRDIGEVGARRRKYKRLKLGGGQAYNH
jgi:hypothetical protein